MVVRSEAQAHGSRPVELEPDALVGDLEDHRHRQGLTQGDAVPFVAGPQRLGREPDGRPAWFVPNAEEPGKFLKVGA